MNMMNDVEQQPPPAIVPYSSESSPCLSLSSSVEELQDMPLAPPKMLNRKRLCKQLSMCETPRDIAWEKRRRQILLQERKRNGNNGDSPGGAVTEEQEGGDDMNLTDEDLHELKGCIELGFGFNEEEGQRLCPTLPALDLYFAVNRQFSPSPLSSPNSGRHSTSSMGGPTSSFGGLSSSFGSPSPRSDSDGWKICSPGDNPQQVKTKLRHWAQAVACSVMQSY